MMTDPIADMLTRIRNAVRIERPYVDIPDSKIKRGIAETLQREGFIWDFELVEQPPRNIIRIHLKYGPNGEKLIREIHRVSTPGRRVHHGVRDMHDVLHGLGVSVLTTSRGVMSNREAKKAGIGGEVLCEVW